MPYLQAPAHDGRQQKSGPMDRCQKKRLGLRPKQGPPMDLAVSGVQPEESLRAIVIE